MISKISSLQAIGAPVPPAVGGALFWREFWPRSESEPTKPTTAFCAGDAAVKRPQ